MLPFTEWAVVLAVVFVASPFYLRQAISAFESVDPTLHDAARTLGASPGADLLADRAPARRLRPRRRLGARVRARDRRVRRDDRVRRQRARRDRRRSRSTIYEQLEASFDVALSIGILLVVISAVVLLSYKLLSWRRSSSTSPTPFVRSSSAPA